MTKVVTLKTIAKQLKMNPKTARRKLRKVKDAPKTSDTTHWAWNPQQVPAVKKLLSA